MKYTIGQVLFVVLSKKNQVYPMQVTEVITKKTLKGEEVSYLLQAGANGDSILLDKIDGEVFDSAETARKTLVHRATQQINRLVDVAVKKSAEWYSAPRELAASTIHELPDLNIQDMEEEEPEQQTASVKLPDGTVAKVKLPSINA